MRAAAGAVCICLLISYGCGYVGPVVPPSPQIPSAVTDLSVVEHGNDLQISFTTPARTTDSLAVSKFSEIELRIGADTGSFDLSKWADTATPYLLPIPPANEKDVARPVPMNYTVPVSDWTGKRVAVAVRTAVKKKNSFSTWSNVERIDVIPPLRPPKFSVQATALGYKLTAGEEGSGFHYKFFRQGPGDQTPIQIGTVEKPEYTDGTAVWDTPYTYTVVAQQGKAESLVSNSEAVKQHDIYPPSVPSALTALASGDSVELSWHRSPEPDFKGYYIYRSMNGSPFERLGNLIVLPTYSDGHLEHGKTYRYQVSAVDQNSNESNRSEIAEVNFP